MATARPMTVRMPNGTSTIPIPEPSTTTSGSSVALKVVSLVVIVTVINVVLDVMSLAFAVVGTKGIVEVVAVVERKLAVVLAVVKAMVWCVALPVDGWMDGCIISILRFVCLSVPSVSHHGRHRCCPSGLGSIEALGVLWPYNHSRTTWRKYSFTPSLGHILIHAMEISSYNMQYNFQNTKSTIQIL